MILVEALQPVYEISALLISPKFKVGITKLVFASWVVFTSFEGVEENLKVSLALIEANLWFVASPQSITQSACASRSDYQGY